MEYRIYNTNKNYICHLIKMSEFNLLREILEKLNLTENAFLLKLYGISQLYIHEGIIVADMLKMDLYDVFCPTETQVSKVLESKILNKAIDINFKEKRYRKFNINKDYIMSLMERCELTVKQLGTLWDKKPSAIYTKLRGHESYNGAKMTLEEGVLFAQLLDMDINNVFCPTDRMCGKIYTKESIMKKHDLHNFNRVNLKLDKGYASYLMSLKGKSLRYLSTLWKMTMAGVTYKLNNKSKINLYQAVLLADFMEVKIPEIFNKNDKLYQDYLKNKMEE